MDDALLGVVANQQVCPAFLEIHCGKESKIFRQSEKPNYDRARDRAQFENGAETFANHSARAIGGLRQSGSANRISLLVERQIGARQRSVDDSENHFESDSTTGEMRFRKSSLRHAGVPGSADPLRQ